MSTFVMIVLKAGYISCLSLPINVVYSGNIVFHHIYITYSSLHFLLVLVLDNYEMAPSSFTLCPMLYESSSDTVYDV